MASIVALAGAAKASLAGSNAFRSCRAAGWLYSSYRALSNAPESVSSSNGSQSGVLVADISTGSGGRAPILLGLYNHFERRSPKVGFFEPIASGAYPRGDFLDVDRHVELMYKVFSMQGDIHHMSGVPVGEAAKLIANGKQADLLDRIYCGYVAYKEGKDMVLIEGPGPLMGGTELDALIAQTLNVPVLMTIQGRPRMSAGDYFNLAVTKRQVFTDMRVPVCSIMLNGIPATSHTHLTQNLKERFARVGLPFAGAIPSDALLAAIRLDEVQAALGADMLYGDPLLLDQEYNSVILASQRLEELLEQLAGAEAVSSSGGSRPSRPLVVTSEDRLDVVLGLLASQLSVQGPTVAGVLLAKAGAAGRSRAYAREQVASIFQGLERGGLYRGSMLPVLAVDLPMYDVIARLSRLSPGILPTSANKIRHCKLLFDRYVDEDALSRGLAAAPTAKLSPKMFLHSIKDRCEKTPQHIVLPEAVDKRILTAAAEVTSRGLARITLLGDPVMVRGEAGKLGLNISACRIIDPAHSEQLDKYVQQLVEKRKGKGMTPESARDVLTHDVNYFGTMMVAAGDADGMVSGAINTTAATIRPGMQVLKPAGAEKALVSSVFFMCLPDRVLVYGDCAVNINPSAAELAQIAAVSADTAAAFGIEPRVALLSYSTLGSGSGPDVAKVAEAAALVRKARPDLKVEGPIQYDAAIDPQVAAVKVKTKSEVAGRATVFIFPDLNTGNNTYKAVQQASNTIAMGPVMQGLSKPVNDLSRGCTVADVVNTICVTSVQAMNSARAEAAKRAAKA